MLKAPLDPVTESLPALALMNGFPGTVLQMLVFALNISRLPLLHESEKLLPRSHLLFDVVDKTVCVEAAHSSVLQAVSKCCTLILVKPSGAAADLTARRERHFINFGRVPAFQCTSSDACNSR